jgi:hypothetical protein
VVSGHVVYVHLTKHWSWICDRYIEDAQQRRSSSDYQHFCIASQHQWYVTEIRITSRAIENSHHSEKENTSIGKQNLQAHHREHPHLQQSSVMPQIERGSRTRKSNYRRILRESPKADNINQKTAKRLVRTKWLLPTLDSHRSDESIAAIRTL